MAEPQQVAEPHQPGPDTEAAPSFRLDVQLHELLMKPAAQPAAPPPPVGEPQQLPEPVFPCRPELQKGEDEDYLGQDDDCRHWTMPQVMHALHGWALPFIKSRVLPGDFHPIIT